MMAPNFKTLYERPWIFYKKYGEVKELKDPVLIEGLPGVGHVGAMAAEYLVEQLKAEKVLSIYSDQLPGQVMIKEGGVVKLVSHDLYLYRGESRDLIFLLGEFQANTPEGQYWMTRSVLELVLPWGVSQVITLGGYGRGVQVEKPRVFGAATDPELVEEFSKYGVYFSDSEPEGGIIGASGLLLGLGKLYGIKGVCLMGETSGVFKDPKAARELIKVLDKKFSLGIDYSGINETVKEFEEFLSSLGNLKPGAKKEVGGEWKEEYRYIRRYLEALSALLPSLPLF